MSAVAAKKAEECRQFRPRGVSMRYQPITAATATIDATSLRLFGDILSEPAITDHRGIWLRYFLRTLYGADYIARGSRLLGVSAGTLSHMMGSGRRVSRGLLQRVEDSVPRRVRRRREELRALARMVEAAFAREGQNLGRAVFALAQLQRMASEAVRVTQPIDARSGRFVSCKQRKFPMLREPPGSH